MSVLRRQERSAESGIALVISLVTLLILTLIGFGLLVSSDGSTRTETSFKAQTNAFEVADAAEGLPKKFDVISTFDVVHDAADPAGLVAGIRRSLADDGTYVMLEINCSDDPADNTGPVASVMYGFSVLYCMTTSLAQGGEGLGTCGCPPAVVESLGHAAGFGSVRELDIGDPFNRLYELRA